MIFEYTATVGRSTTGAETDENHNSTQRTPPLPDASTTPGQAVGAGSTPATPAPTTVQLVVQLATQPTTGAVESDGVTLWSQTMVNILDNTEEV